MLKDLVDDRLILDTGDYLGLTSALWADRHIDIEHPFEALRPGHRLAALFWCLVILRLSWIALAPFGWRYINPVFAVGREYTMESGQVHSWFRHQRRQLGNEIQRFEDDMGGPIIVGRFELITDIP